ncbi:MAG: SLBB domain-containing protein [Nitrospiria bacterium]
MIKPRRSLAVFLLFSFIFDFFSPVFAATLSSTKAPAAETQPEISSAGTGSVTPDNAPMGNPPVIPVEKPAAPQPAVPTAAPRPPFIETPAPPSPIETSFLNSDLPKTPSRTLVQFGYNLFSLSSRTFSPVLEAPVGPNYVLGPGDTLILNVWGMIEQTLQVTLDREGKVFLPKVGPLPLWGLTLEDAKALIQQQLSHYFTNFHLAISMGTLRSIKVFVLGEAVRPGAYDLSAVSTISNALFIAGGPSKIGTMRKIQHIRKNQPVGELDLYDLVLRGDKNRDARLESGDVIFIPTIGPTVGITGNVKRPAIYELSEKDFLGGLIQMAGGITPMAYLDRIQIERVKDHREKVLVDLDLTKIAEGTPMQTPVQDGDLVQIFAIHGRVHDEVSLEGTVQHPGNYAYQEGMKISQILTDRELLPESYLSKAEIVRLRNDFTNEIIPFSIQKLKEGQTDQDLPLLPGDRIVVSTEFRLPPSVTLKGEVLRPGIYSLTPGERTSSVIRRAGGFSKDAYLPGSVFTRKTVAEREEKELNTFVKTQEEKLLAESSAISAGGVSSQDTAAEQASLNERRELLKLLSSKVTLGRVVIHLNQPEKLEGSGNDTLLEDGDTLTIPPTPSSVVVLGSVRNSTGILYQEGATMGHYLKQAGGASEEANAGGIYLIKADGSALGDISLRTPVDRGDTIIVPPSTEAKYRPLPFWRDIATIIGQAAITIATIKIVF